VYIQFIQEWKAQMQYRSHQQQQRIKQKEGKKEERVIYRIDFNSRNGMG
jgi:hypothetical protein